MMNSNFLMLLGAKPNAAAPSANKEPYRVVWNPQVMLGNVPEYIKETALRPWHSDVLATAVLTDYEPLDFVPYIRSLDSDVLPNPPVNFPLLRTVAKDTVGPMMQIPRIKEIANPDRRNKIPKVFHMRYRWLGVTEPLNGYTLMRYNMNAAKSIYVSVQVRRITVGFEYRIEACPDGVSIFNSPWALVDFEPDLEMSDDVRMVIFADRVAIYIGQPGTEITRLALDGPWLAENTATFDIGILSRIDATEPPFETDNIIIYDGNF